jgi:hypothetical protein
MVLPKLAFWPSRRSSKKISSVMRAGFREGQAGFL